MSEIFVNYRTGFGEQAAAHIENHLSRHLGEGRVFRDANSIRAGDDFKKRLDAASEGARVLLVIQGSGWATAKTHNGTGLALADPEDWVRREILNARSAGVKIIPVLCGHNMQPVDQQQLPTDLRFLADLQALRLDHRNTGDDMANLTRELKKIVPDLKATEPSRPRTVQNSVSGTVHGDVVQVGRTDRVDMRRSTNSPTFHGSVNGPVHTGSGDLNVGKEDR